MQLDMGPNPLWLLEDLLRDLPISPDSRVLDLGAGLGATSVFLARELGAAVCAVDLWVSPEDRARVFAEAGVSDRVDAVNADAHRLPFVAECFDAVVSIDAFEYFGTGDDYLPYLAGFVRPGGRIGIATPALTREVRDANDLPEHVVECVGDEALAWHTPDWWRARWESTGVVEVTSARLQASAWRDWLLWTRACIERAGTDRYGLESVLKMLEADGGELLSFALVTARKV